MINMENKKAQGMSTSTIILLVLGLVILVILILGFTMGWEKFAPWLSRNNIDGIKNACDVACSTNGVYAYCSLVKEVNDGENPKFEATCNDLANKPDYAARKYGISPCPQIDCS